MFDHVTYQQNSIQVIDPIARLLLGDEDLLLQKKSPFAGGRTDADRSSLIEAVRTTVWDRWIWILGAAICSPAVLDWVRARSAFVRAERAILGSDSFLLSPVSWVLKSELREPFLTAITFFAVSATIVFIISAVGRTCISALHRVPQGGTVQLIVGLGTHFVSSFVFVGVVVFGLGLGEDGWVAAVAILLFVVVLLAPWGLSNPPWPTPEVRSSS
jgi:hypothetical protein